MVTVPLDRHSTCPRPRAAVARRIVAVLVLLTASALWHFFRPSLIHIAAQFCVGDWRRWELVDTLLPFESDEPSVTEHWILTGSWRFPEGRPFLAARKWKRDSGATHVKFLDSSQNALVQFAPFLLVAEPPKDRDNDGTLEWATNSYDAAGRQTIVVIRFTGGQPQIVGAVRRSATGGPNWWGRSWRWSPCADGTERLVIGSVTPIALLTGEIVGQLSEDCELVWSAKGGVLKAGSAGNPAFQICALKRPMTFSSDRALRIQVDETFLWAFDMRPMSAPFQVAEPPLEED